MSPHREVFRPAEDGDDDPERIFYTITSADVGNRFIKTTHGVIALESAIGYVQPGDVGKRLYRVQNEARDGWLWQCESEAQRDARLT